MVSILFKWLMVGSLLFNTGTNSSHPIYVSVTEIEHNPKDKTLEISCKIFTDDLEKTLRETYKTKVDLLQPKDKKAMDRLISDYVQKHLLLKVDGKNAALQFIGFEQEEEGIISYYQVNDISALKKLEITDNILFEYKKEQMSILHVTVNGKQQSTKLVNPEEKASFVF